MEYKQFSLIHKYIYLRYIFSLVTFNEILPKDKKAKEEKTNMLGQCCIDLMPLLRGKDTAIRHLTSQTELTVNIKCNRLDFVG